MNLSEILRGIKRKKQVLKHHQTVERPWKDIQVGGQLFGVRLPIFNFKF